MFVVNSRRKSGGPQCSPGMSVATRKTEIVVNQAEKMRQKMSLGASGPKLLD